MKTRSNFDYSYTLATPKVYAIEINRFKQELSKINVTNIYR